MRLRDTGGFAVGHKIDKTRRRQDGYSTCSGFCVKKPIFKKFYLRSYEIDFIIKKWGDEIRGARKLKFIFGLFFSKYLHSESTKIED